MRPILIWGGAAVLFGTVIAAVALMSYSHHDKAVASDGQQGQVIQTAQQAPAQTPPAKPQFPHMELQAQYAGPLQDTIIQRWRDPIDGTVCYLYLPILVHHSPPTPSGFVEYGGNGVGSISCMPGANAVPGTARR
jgi:hypothetical protein